MKVSELIAELNKMDPDAEVIVDGHSDGDAYDPIFEVEEFTVAEYPKHSWSGIYYISENESENTISAVHIN